MEPRFLIWPIIQGEAELRARLQSPLLFADKVARLKSGSRRLLEVLAVRCALKELFCGQEQQVLYDDHGAPRLASGDCHISISHTHDYVAVIASSQPVGIDIERRSDRVSRVVSHFLQPSEVELLHAVASSDEDYTLALHLAWSAKEAAFKVLGPSYYDLQHLTTIVQLDWQSRVLILRAERQPQPLQLHFQYTADYVLVWLQFSAK